MARKVKQHEDIDLLECIEAFAHQVPEFWDETRNKQLSEARTQLASLERRLLGDRGDVSAEQIERLQRAAAEAQKRVKELEVGRLQNAGEIIGVKKGQIVRADDPIVAHHERYFREASILHREFAR